MNNDIIILFSISTGLSLVVGIFVWLVYSRIRRNEQRRIDEFLDHTVAYQERLSPEREFFDSQTYELLKQIYRTKGGFDKINEIIIEGASGSKYGTKDRHSRTKAIVANSTFLKNLGVDYNSISIEINSVFVISPFSSEYLDEYRAIHEACSNLNLQVRRGDEEHVNKNLLKYIIELIISADFIIANISGRNPNVLYELAIAQMLEKDIVIVCGLSTELDFDLKQQSVNFFGSRQELIDKLTRGIGRMLVSRGAD